MKAAVGDRLVVKGHKVGEHDTDAEILEVRGRDGGPPYLVRWSDDGHEGLVFPGSDAVVTHGSDDPVELADRFDAEVTRWRGQLDELMVKASLAEMEVRQRVEPLLGALEERLGTAVRRVAEVRDASRESWDVMRTGVEEAIERVKEAAADAAATLDKQS
jgi:hypothetical protein